LRRAVLFVMATDVKSSEKQHPLVRAFDHCPSVLFSFLNDAEAVAVAEALCIARFLVSHRYEFQLTVPLRFAAFGLCPGVRRVDMDKFDELSLLSRLPSTVTSLKVQDHPTFRIHDIPRSVTRFTYVQLQSRLHLVRGVCRREVWPAHLTHLDLKLRRSIKLAPLPPKLRFLRYDTDCPASGLSPPSLPSSLTTLEARSSSFSLHDMPTSLTHLTLYGKYQGGGDAVVKLPPFLRYLHASFSLFEVLRSLPSSLEHVVVTGSWVASQPVPPGIACLFRHAALRTIGLPGNIRFGPGEICWSNLRDLTFNTSYGPNFTLNPSYDQPLRSRDWPNLRTLNLWFNAYSHPLDDLPPSLERLVLSGPALEQPLDKLPPSLRTLQLGGYNLPLDHLPRQLQYLFLAGVFNHSLDSLPSNLEFLWLGTYNRSLDRLPKTLTALRLPACFNLRLDSLPPSLKSLKFGLQSKFNQPLNHLPGSLEELWLEGAFNQPFLRLPRSLTRLHLGDGFNHPLPLVAPAPSSHGQSVACEHEPPSADDGKSALDVHATPNYPSALRSLHLGKAFNQPLPLPSSLTLLEFPFDGAFVHPLPPVLPAQLASLRLPVGYGLLQPSPDVTAGLAAMFG